MLGCDGPSYLEYSKFLTSHDSHHQNASRCKSSRYIWRRWSRAKSSVAINDSAGRFTSRDKDSDLHPEWKWNDTPFPPEAEIMFCKAPWMASWDISTTKDTAATKAKMNDIQPRKGRRVETWLIGESSLPRLNSTMSNPQRKPGYAFAKEKKFRLIVVRL